MFRAFIILLREGLEAFLIVAISVAYLRKSGQQHLLKAIYWGIAGSVVLSAGAAYLFAQAENTSLWEGLLGLSAAVLVSTLIVHMWRHGRRMKLEIEGRLAASALKSSSAAFLGVFLFTLLMITREGMETALLLGTLFFQLGNGSAVGAVTTGAVGGLMAATMVAWLWSRYGHRINLALFFQVTAVFLGVFVVQLFIYGIHELSEAGVLPFSEPIHDATEPYGPDGLYGQFLSYALVALPVTWLAFVAIFRGRKASGPSRIGHHAAVRQ